MEVAIIAALVTALLGAIGWMIVQFWQGWRDRLTRAEIKLQQHDEKHGLHEVKHATIVAHQENLIKSVDDAHEKLDRLIGYANGNSSRGATGKN